MAVTFVLVVTCAFTVVYNISAHRQPLLTMSARQNPNDFLKTLLGRPVVVKLNSGADYRGVLACLDGWVHGII